MLLGELPTVRAAPGSTDWHEWVGVALFVNFKPVLDYLHTIEGLPRVPWGGHARALRRTRQRHPSRRHAHIDEGIRRNPGDSDPHLLRERRAIHPQESTAFRVQPYPSIRH